FQKDAQIITPEALASVKAAITSSEVDKIAEAKKKAIPLIYNISSLCNLVKKDLILDSSKQLM
ncbi:hypothetical protein ACMD2_23997, partial [Ananas comosus]